MQLQPGVLVRYGASADATDQVVTMEDLSDCVWLRSFQASASSRGCCRATGYMVRSQRSVKPRRSQWSHSSSTNPPMATLTASEAAGSSRTEPGKINRRKEHSHRDQTGAAKG